jgi:hypothetical protein
MDFKVYLHLEYLRSMWMDLSQILNVSLGDQTKIENVCNEDELKILKMEYIGNHLLDHTQTLNLSLGDRPYFVKPSNENYLDWKTTSKYQKSISLQLR